VRERIAAQRERLRGEREQTLAKLKCLRASLTTELAHTAGGSADAVDVATDIYEREKTLTIIQTLERKLGSIERALRATEKGSYGICEVCGEAISPGRLEVLPHTTTCVKCQEKLERQQPRKSPITFPRAEE
jgi:DnaK suppressor protein